MIAIPSALGYVAYKTDVCAILYSSMRSLGAGLTRSGQISVPWQEEGGYYCGVLGDEIGLCSGVLDDLIWVTSDAWMCVYWKYTAYFLPSTGEYTLTITSYLIGR